jgi:hypothetical protein
MKPELKRHLLPLLIIFLIISLYWLIAKNAWYQFIFLFLGLSVGSFMLDVDHLLYWLYLNPNVEESRLAQIAFKKHDFISLIKLLEATHHKHTNLIFHHFFFQVVLAAISVFVFTSSGNVFVMSLMLALNIHLLVDEIVDYRRNREHLQDWLFAREQKQLPLSFLPKYIGFFIVTTLIFFFLLLKS